jgi:hypothetical protein
MDVLILLAIALANRVGWLALFIETTASTTLGQYTYLTKTSSSTSDRAIKLTFRSRCG